jgi:hypothetical protein|tara:strand:+ start:233 stop:352 length:120 start_codon:yes stop_codon:yes gene_type:complete
MWGLGDVNKAALECRGAAAAEEIGKTLLHLLKNCGLEVQ